MAKGVSILTTGFSGKFGNAVMRVKGGAQELSAYQPKVKNPRTYKQQVQRARFANAVKFFKQALSGYFQFAYEDKRRNESDYNAFMRHNVAAFSVLTKKMTDSDAFPCIGNPIMLSQGSLTRNTEFITNITKDDMEVGQIGGNGATIAALSQDLIANYGYEEGDIVTLIEYSSSVQQLATSGWEDYRPASWSVAQFIVSLSDESSVADINQRGVRRLIITSDGAVQWGTGIESGDEDAIAWGAIVTRNTSDGLKAITSYLKGNLVWDRMVSAASSAAWVRRVADSWGASDEAILQGAIAGGVVIDDGTPVVLTANGATPPVEAANPASNTTRVTVTLKGRNLEGISTADCGGSNVTVVSATSSSSTDAQVVFTVKDVNTDATLTVYGKTVWTSSGDVTP